MTQLSVVEKLEPTTQLSHIDIKLLESHPDNPRLSLRDDVVASIAEQIAANGFSPAHALIVRPVGNKYQIISGHHRKAAAETAALSAIPCWVEDMDDETAFMQLVLANSQGELTALERGFHALRATEKGSKLGKSIKAYAENIGRPQSSVDLEVKSARVANSYHTCGNCSDVASKSRHLAEIHAAPEPTWPALIKYLIKNEWSVRDVKHYVGKVKEFEIPDEWQFYLPPAEVVDRFLDTREFSPQTVKKLWAEAQRITDRIATYRVDAEQFEAEFREWLEHAKNGISWDVRKVIEYGRELEAKAEAKEREQGARWFNADWREHVGNIEDDSVSLLLTDPPYGMAFQSDRRADRRQDRKHDPIENDGAGAVDELADCLDKFFSKLVNDAHIYIFCHWSNEPEIRTAVELSGLKIRGSLVWDKILPGMGDPATTFAPRHEKIIHAVKGSPVLFEREADVLQFQRCNSDRHPTEKPVELLSRLIEITTVKGELVADPFAGVASTLVAAKRLERDFWGCEIKEDYHHVGSERLADA